MSQTRVNISDSAMECEESFEAYLDSVVLKVVRQNKEVAMKSNQCIKNRSFLKLLDFSPEEIAFLLELSTDLKKAKYSGTERQRLTGKNIVLIFEKSSTRTRCAFETAAYDQGARVTYSRAVRIANGNQRVNQGHRQGVGPHV